MHFFRNPEIKHMTAGFSAISAVFIIIGFTIGVGSGLLVTLSTLLLCTFFLLYTYKRYKRLSQLSTEIDHILHDDLQIHISAYSEGELAILQDEIGKLVIQLREQADAVKKEKLYMADFIADISHQIRTPLTSINLLTASLSEPELPNEKRYELMSEMNKLLGRIDWQISTLLKLSKLDAGTAKLKKEPVRVNELIRLVRESLDIPMELREQHMQLSVSDDAAFEGDINWSAEAISNIIKNCMEHTQSGGTITVNAESTSLYTEIIIRDNGRGIEAEDLPHIFERFYKGRNSSEQSVGIGLALAKRIITEQNGTVKAENANEGGAVFTIHFYKSIV